MKIWNRMLLPALLCALTLTSPRGAHAQGRWEIGNPSIHIDLPGEPGRATPPWAGTSGWIITASAWHAEGNGTAVDIAKLYGSAGKTLEAMLDSIEAKTGSAGPRERGEISGRAFLLAQNETKLAAVIEATPGVAGSTPWGVVMTCAAGGAQNARVLWNSIELEREGAFRPAMRGLGPTKLIAELPYELAPALHAAGETQRRYEATWDGMDVNVQVDQSHGEGERWDTNSTITSYINDMKAKPGVTGFKAERTKIKFSKMTGDLATLTFRQGTRDYKVWKIATFSGAEGYSIEFIIDPHRAEHTLTVGRALETIRTTDIPVWGWKPYALGCVTVEAPSAFTQAKQTDTFCEWQSDSATLPVIVREVTMPAGVMADPDAASAQSVQIMKMLPGMADAKPAGIETRIVDGLPARLVRMTWRNGNFNNLRSELFIYGATRTWVVDVTAADNYKEWHERIFDTVRVRVPESGARPQRIGAMNATFNLGGKPIEIAKPAPPAKEIKSVEQSIIPLPAGGVAAIIDQTTAEDGQVLKPQAYSFYESFSKPLNAPAPTEATPVSLDGARGFHVRGKATVGGVVKDTDFLMLARGKGLFIMFVVSDPNSGDRTVRDEMFNSLRLGGY